jgi:hypothetical protein
VSGVNEKKIIYNDGEETRALRGIIDKEDADFVYVKRRDGIFRLGKKFIVKIEEGNDG